MEEILHQAERREREYDWFGAAESYEKALNLLPQDDISRMAEIDERLGYASYRFAFQAESNDEFRERLRQAILSYEKAKELYGKLTESVKTPKMLRCDAMMALMGYWLASEVSEKKMLLDECWQRTKEALKAFWGAGDALEYGKTYNQLASSAFFGYVLEWDFQAREKIIGEATERGERAITLLSGVRDSHELARTYVKTAMYLTIVAWYFASDMDEKESHYEKGLGYWQKANELSEETTFLELLSMVGAGLDWNIDEMLVQYDKALGSARKTKDKCLIGTALDWLAYATWWKSQGIEDPDKRMGFFEKALRYAEEAKRLFSLISFVSPRGDALWTGAPNADYYSIVAYEETNLRKKRGLLEKAIRDGAHAVKQAESTGYPDIIVHTHHIIARAQLFLAQTETHPEEKKKLLEKALEHEEESMKLGDQLERFLYWNLGARWNRLAELKAELSNVEKDPETKKNMLEEAVSNRECGLQLYIKQGTYFEKKGDLSPFSDLGYHQYSHGESLNRLYGLTNNIEHQRRAIKAFEEAAESLQKLDLVSRMAECYWKAARSYDAIGEHLKAAENFNLASDNYASAAEKIPQLKNFYEDHALYMQAWSEIEKARHHHERQEYGSAEEHFERAANIHRSLKQWSYLAPNYFAWSKVENAEELSRKEQSEEAINAFEQAAKLFNESKKLLQTQLSKIENPDEKQMATNLLKATDIRYDYCTARIAVEEARILDKKGDHYSSSEKYGSAAQIFEKISQTLESEQERTEFKLILGLSRAWQRMTLGEAEAKPSLYVEASQLFEEAREFSPSEKTKMLVLGHSRFCKALEAGTKFADTRNTDMYIEAIKCLESAANYYMRAGFPKASEYSEATKLLFDAYVHMDSAAKESDPEKKAKLYAMAEKVLQASAGSFTRAEHPEKRKQVLGLLEKARKEWELAISLTEVLHAPSIVSTTNSFTTPTPTREEAVGSERFENADIQANLIVRQKELKVGENLDLEIELVNAGKGPALLVKVTEVVPNDFELAEKPDIYRVEDSYLNMKGKRLDTLKTEEVRLVLRPKLRGIFLLKPTLLYLDEKGKYKSHEVEPVTITVKELGIKGWLKGER